MTCRKLAFVRCLANGVRIFSALVVLRLDDFRIVSTK